MSFVAQRHAAPVASVRMVSQSRKALQVPAAAAFTSGRSGMTCIPTGHRPALPVLRAASSDAPPAKEEKEEWEMDDARLQLYRVKIAGEKQPEWIDATFVGSYQLAPGMRQLTLEVEVSRELVPLKGSYQAVGQLCALKIGDSEEVHEAVIASPPFTDAQMKGVLVKCRGDTPTGITRTEAEAAWTQYERIELVVGEDQPELYDLEMGAKLQHGYFRGEQGMEIRPIMGQYTYPTVLMFAEGKGIAAARALIEARNDQGGLNLLGRKDVRLYYREANPNHFCYQDKFAIWEEMCNTKVITTTRSFMNAFDDDDELEYDPMTTAVIIFGDESTGEAMTELLEEAEIGEGAVCREWVKRPHCVNLEPKRKFTTRMPRRDENGDVLGPDAN